MQTQPPATNNTTNPNRTTIKHTVTIPIHLSNYLSSIHSSTAAAVVLGWQPPLCLCLLDQLFKCSWCCWGVEGFVSKSCLDAG